MILSCLELNCPADTLMIEELNAEGNVPAGVRNSFVQFLTQSAKPTVDLKQFGHELDESMVGVNCEASKATVSAARYLGFEAVVGTGDGRTLGPVFKRQANEQGHWPQIPWLQKNLRNNSRRLPGGSETAS